ncbi:MAG TPA: potassium transporter TrkG [Phnomibacter sp.]|nr:potassium transporter TrkG [Phnomibacter sp.]
MLGFGQALDDLQFELHKVLNWAIPLVAFFAACLGIYDIGFNPFYHIQQQLWQAFHWMVIAMAILQMLRLFERVIGRERKRLILISFIMACSFSYIAFTSSLYVVSTSSDHNTLLLAKGLQYGLVFFLAFYELSKLAGAIYRRGVSSAVVFVSSFLVLITIGTGLLLLPRSTIHGLSLPDALFMSTSAVCVTGLATVSLTDLTLLGQLIILVLLQIGGLGVMTFAGLLGSSLSGRSTFQSQLALRDMVNSNHISNVLQTVNTIIGVAFLFELAGMFFLYTTVDAKAFSSETDRLYFAVFHAISAFCNAGFSTLPDGLATVYVAKNYSMQWVVMVLIVLGGMGFPIIFNIYSYAVHQVKSLGGFLLWQHPKKYSPRLLNLTSKLALRTTFILLALGMVFYFLIESKNSLAGDRSMTEIITTSLFASVTSRTAGFHTVDLSALALPSLLFIMLLMWVGASPESTGGGIKTTTMAVAILNLASVVRGKDRTEFNRRQIGNASIRRAFAVIVLSLGIIGLCGLGISMNDGDKGWLRIIFESFSAFSTVGLSLGITSELSTPSKLILSATMFFGRVGTLTLMASIIRQSAPLKYKYPTEEILI